MSRTLESGTWCARNVPWTCTPSTTSGPVQPFGVRRMIAGHRGRVVVNGVDWMSRILRVRVVERRRELLVHGRRIVARDDHRVVAVGVQQADHVFVVGAAEHGRAADLVAVQVEDRQDGAVAIRVEEPHALPRPFERTGLGFAVADDARDDQIGVVERGAERVHERVAELAAFVDRPWGRRADVARDAPRRRELAEETQDAVLVLGDLGIDLGVGALEVHVRDERWPAVARACDVDHVRVACSRMSRLRCTYTKLNPGEVPQCPSKRGFT